MINVVPRHLTRAHDLAHSFLGAGALTDHSVGRSSVLTPWSLSCNLRLLVPQRLLISFGTPGPIPESLRRTVNEGGPMSTATVPALDMNRLNEFIGRFVTDLGAAVHTGMVVIGEKLGLYKALAAGPLSSEELAAKTGTDERYLREWLASQAAGGYVSYDEM